MKCADIRYEVLFASQQLEVLRQCKTVGLQERFFFDVITSIVSFLWEYTTAARDVTF